MKLDDINTDFRVIVAARMTGDWTAVNESSLSRAYRHVKSGQFAIITNHRGSNTPQENREGFYELKHELFDTGYGAITLLGHWRECQDPSVSYDECPPDKLKDVTEPSLFVPRLPLDLAMRYCGRYDQDAFVYAGPETKGQVHLCFRDGSTKSIGDFHPGRIAQAYSSMDKKGRTFVFEWVVQGHAEALIEQTLKRG